jgi:hypothetical protein
MLNCLSSVHTSQLLQVFETEEQREAMRASICHTIHGDYMPSGLTPPTADIVKRRFEQTRKNDGNFIPYRIRNVAQEMSSFGNGTGRMVNATTGEVVADGNANTPGPVLEVVSETVTEEVVDFEEWMVDQAAMQHGRREGVSITLHGSQLGSLRELQSGGTEQARSLLLLLQHPELLSKTMPVTFCRLLMLPYIPANILYKSLFPISRRIVRYEALAFDSLYRWFLRSN